MFGAIIQLHLCKTYFLLITLSMVVLGTLINICEPYLPVFVIRTFRYGKFATKQESSFAKKNEVPKSYFRHFYLTSILIYYPIGLYQAVSVYMLNRDIESWFTTLLDFSCTYNRRATVPATNIFLAVILLSLQVLRRFYETHFVSVFSKSATINISHYFIGMTYYPAILLIIFSEAPKFALNTPTSLVHNNITIHDVGIKEIGAVMLFLWAWYHQHATTKILANVRKNNKGDVVTQGYKIPEGDWFNYLSSPHSTAEILMYAALSVLLWKNTVWWIVLAWVVTNQVETILLSHWWYKSHFKGFPSERKAIVPFVY